MRRYDELETAINNKLAEVKYIYDGIMAGNYEEGFDIEVAQTAGKLWFEIADLLKIQDEL